MKSRILTVSMVLLLIVVATLPGLSFSLSSSVTSYNNQVTIIDDPSESPSFGLYTSHDCSSMWNSPAFGNGIVQVKKVSDADPQDPSSHEMVSITVPQTVSMVGSNQVYLWVPEGVSGDVTLGASYSDESSTLPITRAIFKFDGANETNVILGSTSTVSLAGGHCYKVSLSVEVSTTTTSIVMNTTPSLNIFISASIDGVNRTVPNSGNEINLEYEIEGMKVESNDHVVNGPVTDSSISIDNGTIYKVVDSSGFFGESNKNVSAIVSVDKDHAFYIVIKIYAANNSGVNVKIDGYSSNTYSQDFKSNKDNPVTYYIGVGSGGISYSSNVVGSLVAFQDKDLTITVSTLNTGKPPTTELSFVQVPKNQGSLS